MGVPILIMRVQHTHQILPADHKRDESHAVVDDIDLYNSGGGGHTWAIHDLEPYDPDLRVRSDEDTATQHEFRHVSSRRRLFVS